MGRDGGEGPGAADRDRGARGGRMTSLDGRHVWIDGRLERADGRHISAFDRGFQLGDGVFETLRARAGHPTELEEHLARLRRSAEGLDFRIDDELEKQVVAGVAELLAAEGLDGPQGDASI